MGAISDTWKSKTGSNKKIQSGLLGALKRGNNIWDFLADFYGHDQRKDSDKIIKHIDSQVYIHLINIIKRAKWTERMEIILDRIT